MLLIKRIFLVALLLPSLSISQEADIQAGKSLFNANCAACHQLDKKMTGPALRYVEKRLYEDEGLDRKEEEMETKVNEEIDSEKVQHENKNGKNKIYFYVFSFSKYCTIFTKEGL